MVMLINEVDARNPERIWAKVQRLVAFADKPCDGTDMEMWDIAATRRRNKTAIERSIIREYCWECPVLEQCRLYTDMHERFSANSQNLYLIVAGETPYERGMVRRKKWRNQHPELGELGDPWWMPDAARASNERQHPREPLPSPITTVSGEQAYWLSLLSEKEYAMREVEIVEVEQGSEEWLQARAGVLTASTIGRLLTAKGTVSKGETALKMMETLIAESLTKRVEPSVKTAAMWRGTLDEPIAREHYNRLQRKKNLPEAVEAGFMRRPFHTPEGDIPIGYSPDGLVGDDGLIEIKSKNQAAQLHAIVAKEVPTEHMAQLQMGLLVSGRDWIDYVAFCGGMPLFVKRVTPIDEWQENLKSAIRAYGAKYREYRGAYTRHRNKHPLTPIPDHYYPTEKEH